MCGRYHMGEDTLEEAIAELGAMREAEAGAGDVYPGSDAPVLFENGGGVLARNMRWGFPMAQRKSLLINARAETALVKPSFSQSMQQRRCVMPADAFYEWDAERQMVTFRHPERDLFYLAGCWRLIDGILRYVVLTREANESMIGVHPRMPLLFDGAQAKAWLSQDAPVQEMLRMELPQLALKRPVSQRSLFDEGGVN